MISAHKTLIVIHADLVLDHKLGTGWSLELGTHLGDKLETRELGALETGWTKYGYQCVSKKNLD